MKNLTVDIKITDMAEFEAFVGRLQKVLQKTITKLEIIDQLRDNDSQNYPLYKAANIANQSKIELIDFIKNIRF